MSDYVQSLLCGAFGNANIRKGISANDLDGNLDFYFTIHDEVMNGLRRYDRQNALGSKKPISLLYYALRDLSLQGETVLECFANAIEKNKIPENAKPTFFILGNAIGRHIAASHTMMDSILQDNPDLRIVPLSPGRLAL